MAPKSLRAGGFNLVLVSVSILLLLVLGSCASSVKCFAPSVDGHWNGEGDDGGPPNTHYAIRAILDQDGCELTGTFLWTDNWGGHATEFLVGNIDSFGKITVNGTRMVDVLNKFPVPGGYSLGKYVANISADGDTITGRWTNGVPGPFRLVRAR